MASKREYNISAIDKTVEVLDYLNGHAGASFPELCQNTAIPKSSLYQLLQALLKDRLLRITEDKKYYIGFRMFEYGQSAIQNLDLFIVAHPILSSLAEKTGLTVHLGIVNENEKGIFLDRIDGKNFTFTHTRVGGEIRMETSATGRALIAWQNQFVRERLIKKLNYNSLKGSMSTMSGFVEECEKWVKQGYACDNEESYPNINGIGAPIYDYSGNICAAIACGGLINELDINDCEEAKEHLINSAKKISNNMGKSTYHVL